MGMRLYFFVGLCNTYRIGIMKNICKRLSGGYVYMKKPVLLGLLAAFFFSFTFVLNSLMNLSGGSWLWSASLRYGFMLIILAVILGVKKELKQVLYVMKKSPCLWLLWSTVGFGLFYGPLSLASSFSSSWVVAGTWQMTIIAGAILSPLFYKKVKTLEGEKLIREKIPVKALGLSSIILVGVILIQVQPGTSSGGARSLVGVGAVLLAAFAYPLGNRKMMAICDGQLTTMQRVFGMTLASMPFWCILGMIGVGTVGLPPISQVLQSFLVAICSGVIATVIFFRATEMVRHDGHQLALVEATQAGEVLFTVLGEIVILQGDLPNTIGWLGLALIIVGMILSSLNIDTKS